MPAGHPRVFDSWALIALIQDEPAAAEVERLILECTASKSPLFVSAINLGEVWYSMARRRSTSVADEKVAQILRLGFALEIPSWDLTLQAARYKAANPLSFADCFAAALAKVRKAELVTGDPEFKRLESEIKIHWL